MNWQDLKVHHIGIVVEDIEIAKKPYETVLGMEVVQVYDVEALCSQGGVSACKKTPTSSWCSLPTRKTDWGVFSKKAAGSTTFAMKSRTSML